MPLYKITRTTLVEAEDQEEAYDLELDKKSNSESEIECIAPRVCSECGKGMHKGYLVGGGTYYYCDRNDSECLLKHFTWEEWIDLCDDGESDDNYYTEWEIEAE